MNAWIGIRRPLMTAFLLGCAVSLMTSDRLTWRLVLPATIYWSFVPLCEIGSLALVARRRKLSLARTIDGFFESQTAWLLFVVALATTNRWIGKEVWYGLAAVIFAWVAYRDYGFLRRAMERTPARAVCELAAQRALSWGAALVIFVAPAGWQVVVSWFGL